MNSKIIKFIFTCLTLIASVIVGYFTIKISHSIIEVQGLGSLSLIATIPIAIILYIILAGLLITTFSNFLKCIFSSSLLIKILSIIFLIVTIIMIVIYIGYVIKIIGAFRK